MTIDPETLPGFARRLRDARHHARLRQRDVAELADVAFSTYRTWEAGVSQPQADVLARVARAVGSDPNTLLDWHDDSDGDDGGGE